MWRCQSRQMSNHVFGRELGVHEFIRPGASTTSQLYLPRRFILSQVTLLKFASTVKHFRSTRLFEKPAFSKSALISAQVWLRVSLDFNFQHY